MIYIYNLYIQISLCSYSKVHSRFKLTYWKLSLLEKSYNFGWHQHFLYSGYRPFINTLTRVTGNFSSCIDHIFGKLPETASTIAMTCDLDITDHYATMMFVNWETNSHEKKTNVHKKLNYNKLKHLASVIDWTSIFETQNINTTAQFWLISYKI